MGLVRLTQQSLRLLSLDHPSLKLLSGCLGVVSVKVTIELEQRFAGARMHPLVFFHENVMYGIVYLFQKVDVICEIVFYELKMPDIGRGLFNRIARNQDNLFSVRFRHPKLIKYVGIAAANVGNDDIGIKNLLPAFFNQRYRENAMIASFANKSVLPIQIVAQI